MFDELLKITDDRVLLDKLLPIALGMVVSALLPLPKEKALAITDNPFQQEITRLTHEKISALNELIIVDVEKAKEYTGAFYILRINALFPLKKIEAGNLTITETLLGADRFYQALKFKDLEDSKKEIFAIFNLLMVFLTRQ